MKNFKTEVVILFVVGAAIAAAYATSFHGVFLFDDFPAIFKNQNVVGERAVFSGHRWLADLTFRFNVGISGRHMFSYHLVNLLIHITTALLAYGAIRKTLLNAGKRLGESRHIASAVVLLWGVHPMTTQAVTYICQRYESLMGMCMAGSFYCFARGAKSGRARLWMDGSLLFLLAGMASKEVMAVVPVLLVVYDYVFCEKSLRAMARKRGLFHIASFATLIVLLFYQMQLAAAQISGMHLGGRLGDIRWYSYLYTQAHVILMYLLRAFWPTSLCFDYGMAPEPFTALGMAILIFHVGLLGASVWGVVRRRWYGFAGLFFYAVLAPTSSVVPVYDIAAEHRMYMPLLAVSGVFVYLLYKAFRRYGLDSWRRGFVLATLGLCVVLGTLTSSRNMYYWSEVSMWQDVVAKRPDHLRARNDLAAALSEQGLVEQAVAEYTEVIARVSPDLRKRLDRGEAMVTGAFQQNSQEYAYFVACANLGTMYCNEAGKYQDAFMWYLRALRVAPYHPQVRKSAINLMLAFGQSDVDEERALDDAIRASIMERRSK